MLTILFVILSLGLHTCYTISCSSDGDCELLGKCVNTKCNCFDGWKGDSCSTLDLIAAPNPYFGVWPLNESHTTETCYSWGFTVTKSPQDQLYHAYVNTGCFNISNPSQPMVSGTFLLHLTSHYPTGPFESHDITIPVSSFNPHVLYSNRMQKYVLFFRINELTPYPYCFGNISVNHINYQYPSNLTANSMDVAISDAPSGPWEVHVVTIQNMPGVHISNPSAIELSNGTWVLSYRFNTDNEYVGIAVSTNDYKGPYFNIANLSTPGEDPYFWQSFDDTFHLIFHVENSEAYSNWPSLHAFSNNLYDWNVSNSYNMSGEGCYSTNISWTNGNTTAFYRRERPEIMWDSTVHNKPLYLYTAVQQYSNSSHFGYSYSVIQNIAT